MARDVQYGIEKYSNEDNVEVLDSFETFCITEIIVEVIKAERAAKQMWWSYLFFQLKLRPASAAEQKITGIDRVD